jgi:hypothetical protein
MHFINFLNESSRASEMLATSNNNKMEFYLFIFTLYTTTIPFENSHFYFIFPHHIVTSHIKCAKL